jgi:transposase-like protein
MASVTPPCPKCSCDSSCKNGFNNGKQRYRCGNANCGYNYTGAIRKPSKEVLERIFDLHYLDGLSNRAIAKELGVSDVAVGKWIKKYNL